MNLIGTVLGCLTNVGLVLAIAPFCQGLLRKMTALVQSRQGPPLWQPYMDLIKLLGKEDLESGPSPGLQRLAACLSLAAVLGMACFVPLGSRPPMNEAGDVIVLIYLVTLAGVSTLLAGLAAGSTYSLVGTSREMMTMIVLEPLLAISLVAGSLKINSFRLDAVLNGSVYASRGIPWSGILLFFVMLWSFQGFVHRVPYDLAEAETELMEGPFLEYSGPKLALLQYAQMAKLVVYSAVFIGVFVPWGSGLQFPAGWLLFWVKVLGFVILVTLTAATHARYRIDQALRQLAGLLAVAFGALVAAGFGF
jgi:formate hydrogenlyase subunit 4